MADNIEDVFREEGQVERHGFHSRCKHIGRRFQICHRGDPTHGIPTLNWHITVTHWAGTHAGLVYFFLNMVIDTLSRLNTWEINNVALLDRQAPRI